MQDNRDLEEDYIRRLRLAQERGDTKRVLLIDESRVRKGTFMTIKEITNEAHKFLTREGLGAVRDE